MGDGKVALGDVAGAGDASVAGAVRGDACSISRGVAGMLSCRDAVSGAGEGDGRYTSDPAVWNPEEGDGSDPGDVGLWVGGEMRWVGMVHPGRTNPGGTIAGSVGMVNAGCTIVG